MCGRKKGTRIDRRLTCFRVGSDNRRHFHTKYHFTFILNHFSDALKPFQPPR